MPFNARRFKDEIEGRGLTRTAVAKMSGLHPYTVMRWANGDTEPSVDDFVRVLVALGYEPAAIKAQRISDWYITNGLE